MKTILTILLAFIVSVSMAQYHIRVDCFYNPGDKYDGDKYSEYCVSFTGDNWKKTKKLMHTFDISDEIIGNDVVYQEKLFISMYTSKQEAIEFARDFKSYSQCIEFNNRALKKYYNLLAYRKSHPIKIQKRIIPKEQCCKTTNIY